MITDTQTDGSTAKSLIFGFRGLQDVSQLWKLNFENLSRIPFCTLKRKDKRLLDCVLCHNYDEQIFIYPLYIGFKNYQVFGCHWMNPVETGFIRLAFETSEFHLRCDALSTWFLRRKKVRCGESHVHFTLNSFNCLFQWYFLFFDKDEYTYIKYRNQKHVLLPLHIRN